MLGAGRVERIATGFTGELQRSSWTSKGPKFTDLAKLNGKIGPSAGSKQGIEVYSHEELIVSVRTFRRRISDVA